MRLKTMLQNWLGITEMDHQMSCIDARAISDAKLRKEIADAFEVVLGGDKQGKYYPLWCAHFPDEGRRFEKLLRCITGEQAESAASRIVDARIGSESFIDELVARLRRKQLDA